MSMNVRSTRCFTYLRCLAFGLSVILFFAVATPHVSARSLGTVVVSTCDENSLNNAINQAGSGDSVSFACSGTITLTQTLTINKNVTLTGSGQSVIISGGNAVRVIIVDSGANVTFDHLTIANGGPGNQYGAGLFNLGTVTLTDSTITDNKAAGGAGIDTSGSMTIINSTIENNSASGNGSGIYSSGTTTIRNSTIANNTGAVLASGGGIYNSGNMSISMSTIAYNVLPFGNGGGIYNNGSMSINTSTIANNTARAIGGGIYNAFYGGTRTGNLTITTSTIANNTAGGTANGLGGGVARVSGTVRVGGSIIANNSAKNSPNCSSTLTSQGYNLESGTDCGFTTLLTDQQNVDPQFDGDLADHGGPTSTLALQDTSPASNKIPDVAGTGCDSLVGTTDQRGLSRPGTILSTSLPGALCDEGAYERQGKVL